MSGILQNLSGSIQTLQLVLLVINALLHILFAGAVARDAGRLAKQGIPTFLVSGVTWAFATLVGGVWVVAIYWLVHRSTWTRIL
jgi:hypothetical protein